MYFDHKCANIDLETNETTFINANGEKVKDIADVVLSTDGAFSAIRDAMIRTPRYNFSQTYENYGYKELEIVPDANGNFQMDVNSLHIWPRSSFMMIALPNPGGNFTCTLFMPYDGEVSLSNLQTKEQVQHFFDTYFADAVPMMPNLVDDFFNNPTGHLATMRCYPWVKNNVALMGDSAHAIVPFYGQGMNCSFEDCVVLDECIDKYSGNWAKILDEYQKLRKPNADAIANLALQNFIEMRDLVGSPEFLHKKHVEHDLIKLYSDVYKSQYERVTFSNDGYLDALNWGAKNDALLEKIISEKLEDKITDQNFMRDLISQMK
jgi:kynurenine 3-monooxygenase